MAPRQPPLKSLNMGSQRCFKVRILDQIAIKSIFDRYHLYLVNIRMVEFGVLGTSLRRWHVPFTGGSTCVSILSTQGI